MERVFFTEGWDAGDVIGILNEYEANLKGHSIREYTDVLSDFGIFPSCASPSMREYSKERKYVSLKRRMADIRMWIILEDFRSADEDGKRQLIIDNIVNSAIIIQQKTKGHFAVEKFLKDALGADFPRTKLHES